MDEGTDKPSMEENTLPQVESKRVQVELAVKRLGSLAGFLGTEERGG